MEHLRLKLRVGEHEFEAEGPPSDVHTQFAAFRGLLPPLPGAPYAAPDPNGRAMNPATRDYSKVMRRDGRFITLLTRRDLVESDILLVLIGEKFLRNHEQVMGGEITGSLRRSGWIVRRVDYTMSKLAARGDVAIIGSGRARRYQLTPQGVEAALTLAG